ncbi:MAG TPA: hypothetical protein VFU46_13525 [Gemmatimonadales bacterium]|nr:hypothetical protein [Gemmatimonadales bacterium]
MTIPPLVVPGRPSATGLTWWVLADGAPPSLQLVPPADGAGADTVVHDLRRPGDPLGATGVYAVATRGLAPDTGYQLRVRDEVGRREAARSRTLPAALAPPFRFTIAVGSCYSSHTDRLEIGRSYPPPLHSPSPPDPDPIRLRFLLGDQLYMDLEPFGEFTSPRSDPPEPFARYLQEWRHPKFAPFLRQTPTLALADDHELWNDYPHGFPQPQIRWAWTVGGPDGDLARRCRRGFRLFQAVLNLAPEEIRDDAGAMDAALERPALSPSLDLGPVSFFCLDSRIDRRVLSAASSQAIHPDALARCQQWLAGGDGVAVLLVGPAFSDAPKGFPMVLFDKNLSNYTDDYRTLSDALFGALTHRHVLVIGGDIHRSRVAVIERQPAPACTLHEIVSSPLALIRPPPDVEDVLPPPSEPDRGEEKLPHLAATRRVLEADPGVGTEPAAATIAQQVYATVSFLSTGVSPASPVDVIVRAWTPPSRSDTTAPVLLYQTTLRLRSRP